MPALWTGRTLPTAPWTARRRAAHMPTTPTATSLRRFSQTRKLLPMCPAVSFKAVVAIGDHAAAGTSGSGLRITVPTGVQFRVPRDQRAGRWVRARA